MTSHAAAIERQALADGLLKCGPWTCCDDDDALISHAECQADQINRIRWGAGDVDAYASAERRIAAHGLDMPDAATERGQLARLCCSVWWRRQLRRLNGRRLEQRQRILGNVHDRAGIYVSRQGFARRRAQHTRNARLLDAATVTNQFGQEYTLAELSELGMANPDNRRAELMLRIADTEREAQRLGHVGLFLTITCPSRYHAVHAGRAAHNRKWLDGQTPDPRDAQAYLQGVWSRARAFLSRRHLGTYGIRVVEPHHDGCPHWHLLLWCEPHNVAAVMGALRAYAVEEDWHEIAPRAGEPESVSLEREGRRFDAKLIDNSNGRSAAGYVAKYISKNINGQQFERPAVAGDHLDHYGHDLKNAAPRIESWAATWGVRQFQFFGLPSVTVWREARKVREQGQIDDWLAENGGGQLTVPRLDRPAPLGSRLASWFKPAGFFADRARLGWAGAFRYASQVKPWRRPAPLRHVSPSDLRDLLDVAARAGFMLRLRAACDAGRWAEYLRLMGGAMCKRDDQAARPWNIDRLKVHGEMQTGRYGDPLTAPMGVEIRGVRCPTRYLLWSSEASGSKPSAAVKAMRKAQREKGEKLASNGAAARPLGSAFDVATGQRFRAPMQVTMAGLGRFAPLGAGLNLHAFGVPWTRVNNSTPRHLGAELFTRLREDRAGSRLRKRGKIGRLAPSTLERIHHETEDAAAVYRVESKWRRIEREEDRKARERRRQRIEEMKPIVAGWLLEGMEPTPEMIEVLTA